MMLIFDFDGVISDSLSAYRRACQYAINQQSGQAKLGENPFQHLNPVTFEALAAKLQLNTQKFVQDITHYMHQNSKKVSFFNGIKEAIKELSQKYTLCIVSASSSSVIQTQLIQQGILPWMDAILGGEIHGSKAQKIQQLQNIYAKPAIVIGDSVSDIEAAKKAKTLAIAVTWGWQSKSQLANAKPNFIAHTPCELMQAITSITGEKI